MQSPKRSLFFTAAICALLSLFFTLAEASSYRVLHAFQGGSDGGGLFGRLVRDSRGNLYGTTWGGGNYGYGTVFELSPAEGGSWSRSTLYDFCPTQPHCSDGALPANGLTFDQEGNLYGPASGGPSNIGDIFQLTPGDGGWTFSVIHDGGSSDLIVDGTGNLYGEIGLGRCNGGQITKLKPPPQGGYWIEKDLYDFCPDGFQWPRGNGPNYGLNGDSAGNLYGVTTAGGKYTFGVVFQLERTPKGWKEHVLHNFNLDGRDAFHPYGGVVVDSAGNVYGSTLQGGSDRCGGPGCGAIYRLTKQPDGHWKETILYRFPKLYDGAGPTGTLAVDAAGSLYGVAGGGTGPCGGGGCGVVFRLSPNADDTWTYTVLHRFKGPDGAGPLAGLILDAKGHIFGTTSYGGAGGAGVVFKIVP